MIVREKGSTSLRERYLTTNEGEVKPDISVQRSLFNTENAAPCSLAICATFTFQHESQNMHFIREVSDPSTIQ
jgi:hypothetical protein